MKRYFSLFSGIGAPEIVLREMGWECVGYSEIDPKAIKIYEKNFPKHKNYGDATRIVPNELPDFEFLIAGFPCQAFSISGKRRGYEDSRGTLFFDICRIAKEKRPRRMLLENVRALLSHDSGRTFETILYSLDELGYDAEWGVLDSWFYDAAPRKRIYMHAILRDEKGDDGKGKIEIFPLYACLAEGTRDAVIVGEKNMRDAERIIRKFAKLPDWMDSWDKLYGPEIGSGKCNDGQRGA